MRLQHGTFYTLLIIALLAVQSVSGAEYHVAKTGHDSNAGNLGDPFLTIQKGADVAQPGDTIIVHEGTYRERIDPPRGGTSDSNRIIYQAAAGEEVVIKGSELVTHTWQHVINDTWEVTIPNTFFGAFNPFDDLIWGDWFSDRGRSHHTGSVYLNERWLIESASQAAVLESPGSSGYLLNVDWFLVVAGTTIDAANYSAQSGVQLAANSSGGQCVGYIEHGDWIRFDGVDFGTDTVEIECSVASATAGGLIEFRLDSPTGELLGTLDVRSTGGWQSWTTVNAAIRPLSGVQSLCMVFKDRDIDGLWFANVDALNTIIQAQFQGVNPNNELVEVTARQSVFYPSLANRNYITVRGFKMMHAATPWAPPTAEQIGLIGTHWSKGWIIEDNDISYSACTGITLGKHGDQFDNTSEDSAAGYVQTIERAYNDHGWAKANIGSHVVRSNHVSHCEQAGMVGSLGCSFSTITDNTFHDIHVRKLFSGAEMACVKFHGAIDTLIARNHAYDSHLGMWLDWMTQGTRVTQNTFHDNGLDLWLEVNHGPFWVDNNLFLSPESMRIWSRGATFAHNVFRGNFQLKHTVGRQTPYMYAHSTEVAGFSNLIPLGDDRYYNNIFIGGPGLAEYTLSQMSCFMDGNVFLNGSQPSTYENNAVILASNPQFALSREADGVYMQLALSDTIWARNRPVVETALLGVAAIPNLPYVDFEGQPMAINTDYFGQARDLLNPKAGPFASVDSGLQTYHLRAGATSLVNLPKYADVLAHWSFDDAAINGVYKDDSGNGNDIAITVGTARSTGNKVFGTGALDMGNNEYLTLAGGLPITNTSFSICFWVKRDTVDVDSYVVGMSDGTAGGALHAGFRGSNTNVTLAFWNDDLDHSDTSATADTNEWHHYVFTYDAISNLQRIIIDGDTAGAQTRVSNNDFLGMVAGTGGTTDDLWIGHSKAPSMFDGLVDEVWVFGDVLTDTEISSLYSGNRQPSTFGLWANTYQLALDSESEDADGDGWNNLQEYATGGNPTNSVFDGTKPELIMQDTSLYFVHVHRINDSGLTYTVETSTNLISGGWTNSGYAVSGTNVTGSAFDVISNSVPLDLTQKYIRLNISYD